MTAFNVFKGGAAIKRLFYILFQIAFLLVIYLALSTYAAEKSEGLNNFKKVNTYAQETFSDVQKSAWYSDSVATVYELGLMQGVSKTTFNPTGTITIAETVVLASRIYSIYHNDGYTFAAGEPWYQKYIDYALKHGILENKHKNYLQPATRAEFAAILAMALPANEFDAVNTVEEGAIPDISDGASYLDAVYTLYRAGIISGNDINGSFAPDSNIERCSVAAIITRMVNKEIRRSFSLYAPIKLSYEYFAEATKVQNVKISKLTVKRQQDNCTFKFYYSAKYNATNYSFYGPSIDNVFLQEGIIRGNQNSFEVTIPLNKLQQACLSDKPQIYIKFINSYSQERYDINASPLSGLWDAPEGSEEFVNGETGSLPLRQYGGTNIGINFYFDNADAAYFDEVLPKIAATNAHIKVGVHCRVDTKRGYTVTPMDDANFSIIRMCIEKAQAFGIKVDILMIYMEDIDSYSTPIAPKGQDVASFFRHHGAAAMNVAALCDEYDIPILGLFNECSTLSDSDKTAYWAAEIAAIKALYPDLKFTASSHVYNGETKKILDYKMAGIDNVWNYLDFCGINAYPALAYTQVDPSTVTDQDLIDEWTNPKYPLQSYTGSSLPEHCAAIEAAFGKKCMILEIGCVPWQYGFYNPLAGSPQNRPDVQYRYLKTAYQVLGECDAIAGIYIWDAFDTWTPFYWLDNTELVPFITNYYKSVFRT